MSPRGILTYQTYPFTDKDPVIDQLRTQFQDQARRQGLSDNAFYQRVHDDTDVNVTTFRGWFHGKTKRPQNATIEAAGRGMGKKRVWVDLDFDEKKLNGSTKPKKRKGKKK